VGPKGGDKGKKEPGTRVEAFFMEISWKEVRGGGRNYKEERGDKRGGSSWNDRAITWWSTFCHKGKINIDDKRRAKKILGGG